MSYNRETAMKPLTGDPFDEIILNEREQRHELLIGETNSHAMPSSEYCELRDAYIAMIKKQRQSDGRIIRDIPDEVLAMVIRDFVDERMKIVDNEIINGTSDKEPIGITTLYAEGLPYMTIELECIEIGESDD